MDKKALKNFWFYYKKHILIGLAVLLILIYLGIQKINTAQADYHIGLVRAASPSADELQALEEIFAGAGEDVNGDGKIRVQIHTYYVDLADESENAGVANAEVVQALDADLIGGVSGIFLLEDVDTFQRITNGLLSDDCIPFGDGLFLTLRRDASDAYAALAEKLS